MESYTICLFNHDLDRFDFIGSATEQNLINNNFKISQEQLDYADSLCFNYEMCEGLVAFMNKKIIYIYNLDLNIWEKKQ